MQVGDAATYLQQGPGFIYLFHPALGPLWDVVSQKISGGRLAPRSELVLEVRGKQAAVQDSWQAGLCKTCLDHASLNLHSLTASETWGISACSC